jgi:hypothetical protein
MAVKYNTENFNCGSKCLILTLLKIETKPTGWSNDPPHSIRNTDALLAVVS